MKKHIFLTGFMGAGKSRIGRTLAAKWGWPFYDTDALVEEESGLTVMRIFEEKGEAFFREKETEIVKRVSIDAYPAIIALGGGTLMQPSTYDLIRENGLLIYIKSSPEKILERVRHTDKRPLLKMKKDEQFEQRLLERIKELSAQREPVYAQADIVYRRDGLEPDRIVAELHTLIQKKWDE